MDTVPRAPQFLPQVFPQLYLPVMAESNLRAVRPWREWLPTPSAWRHSRCLAALNEYITRILRERWRARAKGAASAKPDILDRLLASTEARSAAAGCLSQGGLGAL